MNFEPRSSKGNIFSKLFKFILQKKIIIGKETECHLIETEVAIEAVDSRGQL